MGIDPYDFYAKQSFTIAILLKEYDPYNKKIRAEALIFILHILQPWSPGSH